MSNSTENKDITVNYNANFCSRAPNELTRSIIDLSVPPDCVGLRLDQALAKLLPHWSRNRLQSWILEKRIMLDGQATTPKQKVWGNEQIQITPHEVAANLLHAAEDIRLDIVYEDEALIIINKPAGMVVHPGNGNWHGTLLNALLHHATELNHIPRAGIVHRLDKNTSGLLVVAKTIEAQTSLVRQLQKRAVKREYLALVLGQVVQNGCVDAPIGRHPIHRTKMAVTEKGKEARTHYLILEHFKNSTLLQCSLETGRTHQIRVHMHTIGHPLVGDPIYGGKPKRIEHDSNRQLLSDFTRQALHAQCLELSHPVSGKKMQWHAAVPDDMNNLLQKLQEHADK